MRAAAERYLLSCIILLSFLISVPVFSQQNQPVHIQSEGEQPYYVQLQGMIYTSSASGYLIIPKLIAGEYILVFSFPGSNGSEYAFPCTIEDQPKGFALKLNVDNSWSLFDMVDFSTIKGTPATKAQLDMAARKPGETDPVPIVPVTPVKPNSTIRKIFDKASAGGIDQVYVLMNGDKADTIALFIQTIEDIKPTENGMIMPSVPAKESHVAETALVTAYTRRQRKSLN